MSSFEKALPLEGFGAVGVLTEDRRYNTRGRLFKEIRVCSLDCSEPKDVGTVIDLSRNGLYFTVGSSSYKVGMPLRLAFPDTRSECLCEVVRIEPLPQGRFGIGARILSW